MASSRVAEQVGQQVAERLAPVSDTDASSARVPGGVCRLYLVRHGTTTMNVENRYRGRRDVPLDAQGWADAVEAARELSPRDLTAVYAGPLRRTINTAQVIADECRIPDVRILHGLVNLDYGEWEGMTAEEAEIFDPGKFALYRTSPLEAICPSGERLSDAQLRMQEAIRLIGSRHAGESVAAVTHAVMIRLFLVALLPLSGEKWRISVGRGSLTTLEIEDRDVRLIDLPAGENEQSDRR
jgi:broad specificity phosphatase PhoE